MTEYTPLNMATCRLCLTTIESKYTHDFVWCKCGAIAVDGGQSYMKRVGNPEDFLYESANKA